MDFTAKKSQRDLNHPVEKLNAKDELVDTIEKLNEAEIRQIV